MYRVLLIDDDEVSRFISKKCLIHSGYVQEVVSAESGRAAVKLLKQPGKQSYFDIIILDLNLPIYSGIEFLKKLQSIPSLENPDIFKIVLSNSIDEIEIASAMASGANYFIEKPLSDNSLYEALEQFWQWKENHQPTTNMNTDAKPLFKNGKVCYLEIPALDLQQSSDFYKKVFNWRIRQDQDGNLSFDDSCGQVSGMWVLDRKPDSSPGILISIMVSSISDTLQLVLSNNGKSVEYPGNPAPDILAKFSDPAGNVFCLYQDEQAS